MHEVKGEMIMDALFSSVMEDIKKIRHGLPWFYYRPSLKKVIVVICQTTIPGVIAYCAMFLLLGIHHFIQASPGFPWVSWVFSQSIGLLLFIFLWAILDYIHFKKTSRRLSPESKSN
jgi:hypothetical protein